MYFVYTVYRTDFFLCVLKLKYFLKTLPDTRVPIVCKRVCDLTFTHIRFVTLLAINIQKENSKHHIQTKQKRANSLQYMTNYVLR